MRGSQGYTGIAGALRVEAMSRVMAFTAQKGSHKALTSQKTRASQIRKGKDVLLIPSGKEFTMKIFKIHDISGAHSSLKIPKCQMLYPSRV